MRSSTQLYIKIKSKIKHKLFKQKKWLEHLSSTVTLAQNTKDALLKRGFVPEVAIGLNVTCLETICLLKRTFGCKIILDATEHVIIKEWSGTLTTAKPEELEIIQGRIDHLIPHLDNMYTIGTTMARALSEYCKREVFSVTNARWKRDLVRSNKLRHKIKATNSDIVCVWPNSIAEGRGFENIIEAFRLLPPNFKLVQIGRISAWGGFKKYVAKIRKDKQLANRLFFLPEVAYNDFPQFISGADLGIICLIPNYKNILLSFPNRFHDLVDAGVPIFTSDIPNISEYVNKEQLGAVFTDNEPATIAHLIQAQMVNLAKYRDNIIAFRNENIWENQVKNLINFLPHNTNKIALIVKKDITTYGRSMRLYRSLIDAGKEVVVVAPRGVLPFPEGNRDVELVVDGILNSG